QRMCDRTDPGHFFLRVWGRSILTWGWRSRWLVNSATTRWPSACARQDSRWTIQMDKNEDGQPTRQRWFISEPAVTVDFLIEPDDNAEAQAGRLFPLTRDWAAIIAPGLHLAFSNNQIVTMDGRTIVGETARRDVRVCGAGAFVVLKALAFHIRGENKDAYDLFYLLRNYGGGVSDVVGELRPLLLDASAVRALEYLRADFQNSE